MLISTIISEEKPALVAIPVTIAALAVAPRVLPASIGITLITVLMYAILTLSWAMFSGPTRYVSLATAGLFGVGVYVTAVLRDVLPIEVLVLLGGVIAFVVAAGIGLLTLRLRGAYGASGRQPGSNDALRFFTPTTTPVDQVDTPGLVLSALGTYLFVREVTGSARAAFVAGLLFAFAPYRMGHSAHLNLLSVQWAPFALYGLRRYFDTGRRTPLAGAPRSSPHCRRSRIHDRSTLGRRQRELGLAAGQRVAETARGAQGRGAGREDPHLGIVVGGDLEQLRGIAEAMDLVEDDRAAPARTRIIRSTATGQEVIQIDMNAIIRRGQREKAILLRENDVVVVPESFF